MFSIKSLTFLLFVAVVAEARGILQALKNDYHPAAVPECNQPQILPVTTTDPQIITNIEKPPPMNIHPFNFPYMNLQSEMQPRVIGHTYHIYRTVVRTQMFRQMIVIPYLQRYIRTFQAPVLETIHIQRDIPF